MTGLRFPAYALVATFFLTTGFVTQNTKQAIIKPPITIVTDESWDISGQQTQFGEYPLSAGQIASATSPLYGGTYKPVAAEFSQRSKVIPGALPIWRHRGADTDWEAYQFRKTVQFGADPIQKITLEVNCDDAARFYINQRLVTVDKRDGTLRNNDEDPMPFRSLTAYLDNRVYTYDVTDYFFTNFNNTILVEVANQNFDGNHAYLSARFVIETAPKPEPPPAVAKRKPVATPKAKVQKSEPKTTVAKAAAPEKIVFEAGHDPEIEKLHVGSILELGHVYFQANDYQLDSASYRTLSALAAFMIRHPGLKIEVGGHTNLRPTDRFADELSANRAQSVLRYLRDNGVAADRVTFKGYGKSQPRVQGISRAADRVNQRVEVKVLEK
ncbi:MAG: OmpA family protein [Saprospiraceae bacterium]